MQKKIRISMAAVAALMLVILAVNLALGAVSVTNTPAPTANTLEAAEKADVGNSIAISPEQAADMNQLRQLSPATPEEAERNIYPTRNRFLLWTNDGVHIMWGVYGNGRFVGTDNLGKRCWGIYGKGIFAGFYGGEFFWGKYNNGSWTAEYLFGVEHSRGEYVLFPSPAITADNAASP